MPSQQEVKWSQLKVGVIVIVSTVILCTLLFLMTSASGGSFFSKKIVVDAYFSNSAGLKQGGEVQLQGVTIGTVKAVRISTDPARKLVPVHVIMALSPKYHDSLREDSKASLTKEGLVGDTVVNINSQLAHGPELKDGDQLPTFETSDLDAVMAQSKDTLETLNSTLGKLNAVVDGIQKGQGTVGQLVKNPELFDNLNQTVAQMHELVANINSGKGSAGKLLHDDDLYNHLNATAKNLDTVSSDLTAGKGSAGKLLHDDALYNNLNSSLAHMNSLLAEADSGKGGLGLLIKDPAFAKQLNGSVTNLNALLSNVNEGKGTLGKLATDDKAYSDLDKLLNASTDLVTTIRSDPKKYLTIHMKIF